MPDEYKKEFPIHPSQPGGTPYHVRPCARQDAAFYDIPDEVISTIRAPALIIIGDKDVPLPGTCCWNVSPDAPCAPGHIPGGHGTYMGELTTLKEAHTPPVGVASDRRLSWMTSTLLRRGTTGKAAINITCRKWRDNHLSPWVSNRQMRKCFPKDRSWTNH